MVILQRFKQEFLKYHYALCKETMVSIQKKIKMNIDHTHKTLTLLGHFSKSRVKSMTYRDVFIEWE